MKAANSDKIYEEIGKRIVAARKAKGLSQEKLATDSQVDRSHMGFIEQGRRRPTVATLYRITDKLDMTLEELFRGIK